MNKTTPGTLGEVSRKAGRPLLRIENLTVDVQTDNGDIRIIDQIDFAVDEGEHVALVGESGSGKSVTARAIMQLDRQVQIQGRIAFEGRELLGLSKRAMGALRGDSLGMVFQDPMSSLDPLMTIGDQVAETLRIHGVSKRESRARALAVLEELGVTQAAERMGAYPHEFSGGMRQRVVLAMALIGEPKLLIADEPTTALDVRVQQQVLEVLDRAAARRGSAVLLITHDLGIVAGFADRVMVMYSGRIVEDGPVEEIFARPRHPYTRGLIAAVPRADRTLDRLVSIEGTTPSPAARPSGCPFHPRCPKAQDICARDNPALEGRGGVRAACHFPNMPGEGA